MKWQQTILGEPCSKANQRRAVPGKRKDGRPFVRFIKSEAGLHYVDLVERQVGRRFQLLTGDLSFHATIFYGSRRKDLDPSLILDALQGLVFLNDSQVVEIHVVWKMDKERPRADVTIEELGTWKKARKRKS